MSQVFDKAIEAAAEALASHDWKRANVGEAARIAVEAATPHIDPPYCRFCREVTERAEQAEAVARRWEEHADWYEAEYKNEHALADELGEALRHCVRWAADEEGVMGYVALARYAEVRCAQSS